MNRRPNALRSLLTRSLPLAVMTLLTAFCLLPSAFSQSATATISGTVVDQQGAVVPGATVTVINAATGQQRQATTGDEGNFTVPSLPPATYTIRVEREGFAIAEVSNVVLNVNDQKSISIPLKAGTISEMVKITGEAPLINESPAVATTIDRTFVGNLPLNGRSFQSLILLTPGVTLASDPAASDPGQFSVNG
ncbi:MAG TPA: carboxypeptidase-like regulatory domain-containing protein, partial [Pyrinomonadaceae bacterium]|nr:carboxypeptidase-like regulatory domain-containing protein [Pyrinomonadaceae bacterium]